MALAAERAARQERTARSAERARIAAKTQATQRAAALGQQGQAISSEQKKLKARAVATARAAAAAKREAAKRAAATQAAAARARAARGYEAGVSDPKEMARQILKNKYGYGADQFSCFNNIIIRESMWKVTATNPSSGAYGIPQALPGSKMATVASDWRTNPATQIIWGSST